MEIIQKKSQKIMQKKMNFRNVFQFKVSFCKTLVEHVYTKNKQSIEIPAKL